MVMVHVALYMDAARAGKRRVDPSKRVGIARLRREFRLRVNYTTNSCRWYARTHRVTGHRIVDNGSHTRASTCPDFCRTPPTSLNEVSVKSPEILRTRSVERLMVTHTLPRIHGSNSIPTLAL